MEVMLMTAIARVLLFVVLLASGFKGNIIFHFR